MPTAAMATAPNVLFVGDAEAVRQHAFDLDGAGSFRLTAVDAAGATAAVRDADVAVAVVDVAADGAGGVQLAWRLREASQNLPIVMIAGSGGVDVAIESMRIGAVDCLLKPCEPAELVAAIDRAVLWRATAERIRSEAARLGPEMRGRSTALVQSCADSAIGSTEALDAWLTAVYRKDVAILEHVRRVSRLSVAIGTALGLDPAALGHIGRAALLHDIGKVAIPPDVMTRPGPLSAFERQLARVHVRTAYDVASASEFLRPCADMLLASRERYDGSGYPRRLSVDAIPIGARVIAVAEAYDTLTFGIAPFEPDVCAAANAEIVRAAGLRFDPTVVRAWLQCVDAATASDDGDDESAM